MIKNGLKILLCLLFAFALNYQGKSQYTITIGDAQFESLSTSASPYNNYFRSRRVQIVYTAEEINEILTAENAETGIARNIKALAWNISQQHSLKTLNNYQVGMAHTSETDASSHNDATLTIVKESHTYSPESTGWQAIEFDDAFEWDGTSNILVDVCWRTTYWSSNGRVWMYQEDVSNQMRARNSDSNNMCGWTTNETYSGKAQIQFTFECDPIDVSVGSDDIICNQSSITLTGNEPDAGHSGMWTVVQGEGSFDNEELHNTELTNIGPGENIYRWTITHSNGCSDYAEISITNNTPTQADAGPDDSSCSPNYSLNGNIPSTGTGQWSVVEGSGIFSDYTVYNTQVSNLTGSDAGTVNTFRWTITNNGCSSYDDVNITYYYPAVATVDEGNLSACYNDESVDLILNGNDPSELSPPATGQWTVISGAGEFEHPENHNTTVNNVGTPTNTYRWTLTRNGCISSANVVVNNLSPSAASAGTNQTISSHTTTLQANTPTQGEGTWTVEPAGPSFDDDEDPNSIVNDISEDILYTFRWTISVSEGGCEDSYDEITIARIPDLKGMVINKNLTNHGSFSQVEGDENYFIMAGENKKIDGGLTTNASYNFANVSILGTIEFDGRITSGKFNSTLISIVGELNIENERTYKNHALRNLGELNIKEDSRFENSGDWINEISGTINSNLNSTVVFNGNDRQSIFTNWDEITEEENVFANIVLNNTAELNADIEIQEAMKIRGQADFNNGIVFYDGDGYIIFGDDASTTGGNSNSFINGRVIKTGSSVFTYPTGDVIERDIGFGNQTYVIYGPFAGAPEAPTDVAVQYRFTNENLPNWWAHPLTHEPPLNHTTDREYWYVESDQNIVGTILHWNDNDPCYIHDFCDDEGNFLDEYLTIAYHNGTKWIDLDGSILGGSNKEIGSIQAQNHVPFESNKTDEGKFVTFAGTSPEIPLPIELAEFSLECNGEEVNINWITASELNNDYFTIEKSYDAVNYFELGRVNGSGFSRHNIEYSLRDNAYPDRTVYYRLKQTDFDGTSKTFSAKAVKCNGGIIDVNVYPNPFRDHITIKSYSNKYYLVQIFDSKARTVYSNMHNLNGEKTILLEYLSPGLYYLRISDNNNEITSIKLVKDY